MPVNKLKHSVMWAKHRLRSIWPQDTVILNSAKSNGKNVLLSYITRPFIVRENDPSFYSHTNTWECLQIAKIWLNHGFNVDVIDWDNSSFIPRKDYHVFIDIHSNMERLAPLLKEDCLKILHITGAHWRFQNAAELKRIEDLYIRRGIRLQPRRQVPPSNGIECADCATILGNKFTKDTFAFAGKPLFSIPLSTTIQFPYHKRDFHNIRNSFLWFGSSGMVHKGLDLVLDAFSQLPSCKLTICGPVKNEPDFEAAYYKELYRTPNIKTLGFIDIRSEKFQEIIQKTSALIYPSCSEGQAGSVVTCLHAGLIPIISYESGVDIDDFGILLKNNSVDEIIEIVKDFSKKDGTILEQMSRDAWNYARTNHTREKFSECYNNFVTKILMRKLD